MRSNTKILNRIVYFWLQCDGKEAELQRHSLPMAATESGASWLAKRASMMPFGLCMCRASWWQACTAADGASQETPCPLFDTAKKNIVSERGLLKTAFPMKLIRPKKITKLYRSDSNFEWCTPRSHIGDVLCNSEPDSRRQFSQCFWSDFLVFRKMCVFVSQCVSVCVTLTSCMIFLCPHSHTRWSTAIPLGVTLSNAVSKLKAQSSKVSFHWNVAKETFELWALSFRKCHP